MLKCIIKFINNNKNKLNSEIILIFNPSQTHAYYINVNIIVWLVAETNNVSSLRELLQRNHCF